MTSTSINYADTYFQFPVLTKIHGEPSFESLRVLHDEIKANALAVTSTLGGGQHGHLGLALSNTDYARISNVPYTRPPHPGLLQIPNGITQHEATRLDKDHKERLREWREAEDIEKTLIKQIVAAVEPKYIKSLRNRLTNSITSTVPDVLNHLKERYGLVPPDVLAESEKTVRELQYDLREPMSIIFDEIEDLEVLGIEATIPYSQQQLINFATDILMKSTAFEPTLILWNARPAIEKTWTNLKQQFENAHKALRLVRGKTMQDTNYHQANHMAAQVLSEIKEVQNTVLQALDLNRNIEEQQQANAITTTKDAVQLEILQLLKALQTEMKVIKETKSTAPFNDGKRNQRNNNKYCWTHGATNHTGKNCNKRKDGHQEEATFKNKMGGSTYLCREA